MKHKYGAVCFAAMLLLTGCVRDGNTDLSERYPAYFRYCFGDDAACQFVKVQDDAEHLYRIVYSGKDGSERSADYQLLPYDAEKQTNYQNAKAYYDVKLEQVVLSELTEVIRADFTEQVLKKHFPDIRESGQVLSIGAEAEISVVPMCLVQEEGLNVLDSSDPVGAELCAAHLTPVTGWRVCDAEWTAFAADPQWFFMVSVTVTADADAADYLEKLKAVYAEYRACTDQPQSCAFLIRQSEPEHPDNVALLWRKNVVFGEEVDMQEENASDTRYNMWDEITEKLKVYYQNAES